MRFLFWYRCSDTWCRSAILLLIPSLIVPSVLALYVVPGSNCTSACLSTSTAYNTNGSDIVCNDRDYNSTAVGKAFEDCVSCEIQSPAFNSYTVQTDIGWGLCKPPSQQVVKNRYHG